jgi:hypothetical protein
MAKKSSEELPRDVQEALATLVKYAASRGIGVGSELELKTFGSTIRGYAWGDWQFTAGRLK